MNKKSLIFSVIFSSVFAFATSNKVLEGDIWKTPDHSKVYTPPAATDTLVGRVSTDTLTNKSMSGSSNTFTNLPFSAVTGTVPVNQGGTNLTSGTSGGILGYTASGVLASSSALTANQVVVGGGAGATPSTLSAGAQYQPLVMGASNPGYSALNLGQSAAITGTLPVGNGGSGLTAGTSGGILGYTASGVLASSTALTANQLMIGGGAGATPSTLSPGSQYQSLVMGASNPGYGAVNLGQSAAITGTLPTGNGGTGVTSVSTAPTPSAFAGWDANSNLSANNHLAGYATTATAAGTTTLTVASAQQQYFTGSTTQTVKLPVTSTLVLGQSFIFTNNSSGTVTIQSSGTNTVQAMAAASYAVITCISTSGTGAASWNVYYSQAAAGGGSVTSVAMTVPTGFSISGSPVTTSGTFALTYSGTAIPVANGGTGQTSFSSGALSSNGTSLASGTLAVANGGTAVTAVTTSPTVSSFAGWDANKNLSANNHLFGYTTTATASGTTTLSVSSTQLQYFTGTLSQTVKLPDATTLALNPSYQFTIKNKSTSPHTITVVDNGSTTLGIILAGGQGTFVCTNIGSAAGTWDVNIYGAGFYTPSNVGSNTNINSLALNSSRYMQINGVVTISGFFNPTASGSGTTSFTISLPNAPTLGSATLLNGTAAVDTGGGPPLIAASVFADTSANGAKVLYTAPSGTIANGQYIFTYQAY